MSRRRLLVAALSGGLLVLLAGCADSGSTTNEELVLYSGRSEELVAPLVESFEQQARIDVEARYGSSAEMAATILTEGANSPADVFFAQEPASLGSVAALMAPLPESVLSLVPDRFRDPAGLWVGTTVRSRVLAFNPDLVGGDELPASYKDLVDPKWSGKLGIAPTNASFIAFVSAQILLEGTEATLAWLQGIAANNPVEFDGNSPIAAAVDAGDVEVGLINHYYLLRLADEQGSITARNHFFEVPDAGALLMPAGASILRSARHLEASESFLRFLLSVKAQSFFAESVFEYPVVPGSPMPAGAPPLADLVTPTLAAVDLAEVLDQATDLIAEAGLL
ncbi:MAG TPA: extracellular solute-binding protein [Acidimicrobiia bacterium]|nr:extracellular solute-binding protein [Acidimicrobiia bacterium]